MHYEYEIILKSICNFPIPNNLKIVHFNHIENSIILLFRNISIICNRYRQRSKNNYFDLSISWYSQYLPILVIYTESYACISKKYTL